MRAADADSDYTRAVQSYLQAAGDQLRAIRASLEAEQGSDPSDTTKQRYAGAFAKLGRCDNLLTELKKADAADFDRVKLQFEQMRADMLKTLDAARKG